MYGRYAEGNEAWRGTGLSGERGDTKTVTSITAMSSADASYDEEKNNHNHPVGSKLEIVHEKGAERQNER
jgi:hypothetical protein